MFSKLRAAIPPMVLGLLALAFPPQVLGLQLSDLIQSCRIGLRDTASDTNFQRFPNSTLIAWINEGQRDAQNKSWVLQGYYFFDLTAAQRAYQTPSDFLYPVRVILANKRVQQTAYNQLDSGSGSGAYGGYNWTTITSTSTKYYLDNFASTVTLMGFYPLPQFTTSGGAVQVQYAQIPITLVNLTDIPFDGKQTLYAYHDILAHYCAMKGWQTLDRNDLASGYASLYAAGVAAAKTGVNMSPDYNPSVQGYTGPPGQQ